MDMPLKLSDIRLGMLVKCIEVSNSSIEIGKLYVVLGIYCNCIQVNNGTSQDYYPEQFVEYKQWKSNLKQGGSFVLFSRGERT